MTSSREEVLLVVADLIRQVVDEDWIKEVEITMDTSFADELELESIEFVALAEKIQAHYGRRVDFAGWLAAMEIHEIIGLRLGKVVDFIVACLSTSQ